MTIEEQTKYNRAWWGGFWYTLIPLIICCISGLLLLFASECIYHDPYKDMDVKYIYYDGTIFSTKDKAKLLFKWEYQGWYYSLWEQTRFKNRKDFVVIKTWYPMPKTTKRQDKVIEWYYNFDLNEIMKLPGMNCNPPGLIEFYEEFIKNEH